MKKTFFSLLVLFLVSLGTPKEAKAVDLGPFKVGVQFCEQVQKLAPILNVYSTVQWPVTGFPGITFGLSQNTSSLLDFCDFIMQIEQLGTQDAIFFAANFGNKLTNNKWTEHLDFASQTWDLANNVYDFESGEQRKGALESASTHRAMNDYVRDSYRWYNKTFNSKEASLKTRGQTEADLNRFSNIAYERAILAEALNCPGGDTNNGDTNYADVYSNKVKKQEDIVIETNDNILFYKSKLLDMGTKFTQNQEEMEKYVAGIENMQTNGVTYSITQKPKQEITTKPGSEGMKTPEKVTIVRQTQVFKAKSFTTPFTEFRSQWGEKWNSYVDIAFHSTGVQGLLSEDPKARIEDQFRDLSYECNPTVLMRGVNIERPDYLQIQDEKVETCKRNTVSNQKKASGLLNYYVEQMQQSLLKHKQANAIIWTEESWHLGVNRAVSKDGAAGFQKEKVTCAEQMSPVVQQKIANQQQQVEAKFAEITAQEITKQNIMQSAEMDAKMKDREDRDKKRAYGEDARKNEREVLSQGSTMVPISGTIKDE